MFNHISTFGMIPTDKHFFHGGGSTTNQLCLLCTDVTKDAINEGIALPVEFAAAT